MASLSGVYRELGLNANQQKVSDFGKNVPMKSSAFALFSNFEKRAQSTHNTGVTSLAVISDTADVQYSSMP